MSADPAVDLEGAMLARYGFSYEAGKEPLAGDPAALTRTEVLGLRGSDHLAAGTPDSAGRVSVTVTRDGRRIAVIDWRLVSGGWLLDQMRYSDDVGLGPREPDQHTIIHGKPLGIASYDPAWPARFEQERERIVGALRDLAVRIEHVGSTSVPGLGAKPIVDIQVSVPSLADRDAYLGSLQSLGYVWREDEMEAHEFFKLNRDGERLVNLHVCEAGGEWERRHLEFRDRLRADPDLAARYEAPSGSS